MASGVTYLVEVSVFVLVPLVFVFWDLEGLGYLLDETVGVGVLVISTPELDEVVETAV